MGVLRRTTSYPTQVAITSLISKKANSLSLSKILEKVKVRCYSYQNGHSLFFSFKK
ncbi:hypothetical protein BDF20DRAFT_902662 [Mycotypha africana]|uniref:uncharacterized protein n=1 Tax=Mycotypha africana TaxID=64632 RepID=UPI002301B312|nr:uncharacterized protein BDF20DRAFT_902662 [Mycotypha africana]KAI8967116.1 hypothetical protein BDF20DRAFT_902662 [Mycotypha africana]